MNDAERLRWMEAIYYVYCRDHQPKSLDWHRYWLAHEIGSIRKAQIRAKRAS